MPKLPEHYEKVRLFCALAITALALKAMPTNVCQMVSSGSGTSFR